MTYKYWITENTAYAQPSCLLSNPGYDSLAAIGIVIFCMVLVLEFNRTKFLPKTLNNAVDSSLAIYVASLNIVVHIMGILGKLRK